MTSILADLRYALRGLLANPIFTLAVVVTLALGIGAATSIFAAVDAILLRPVAYRDAERWSDVFHQTGGGPQPGIQQDRISEWRRASGNIFDAWILHRRQPVARTDGEEAQTLSAVAVTPGAETLLGIPIELGRGFTPEDARSGAPTVAILGHEYWRRLGADPDVIGSSFRTPSGPVVIVGVLGNGTKFPLIGPPTLDLWIPLREDFTAGDETRQFQIWAWAHMRAGITRELAQRRLDVASASLADEHPGTGTWDLRLKPLGDDRAQPNVRRALWALGGGVGSIYLIALMNGVGLLLVRGSARRRKLAVRASLGASRARLLRQTATEGLLLGVLGGVAAWAIASLVVTVLRSAAPETFIVYSPYPVAFEARTKAFVVVVSVLAGGVLGLLPGLWILGANPARVTELGSRGDPPAVRRLRSLLVAGQVGLSTVLLVGAVLLAAGMASLLRVDTGFDVNRVAFGTLGDLRSQDAATRAELAQQLEERLEAIPEIESVAVSGGSGFTFGGSLEAEGGPALPQSPEVVPFTAVGPSYFRTVGARLIAGRGFEPEDVGTDRVVVDHDLATLLWGDGRPIGKRFRLSAEAPWLTVVGVVQDLRLMGQDDRGGPHQFLRPRDPDAPGSYLEIAMRTAGDPKRLLPLFRSTLRNIDAELTSVRVQTAAQRLAFWEETPRFLTGLMLALAGIAVSLAAVGLYGMLAYSVVRRQRELGIRVALGAQIGRLRRRIVAEGVLLAAYGGATGIILALAAAPVLEPFLYRVEPRDPVLFAATTLLLLTVAAVASLGPARRATRADPVEVLRAE